MNEEARTKLATGNSNANTEPKPQPVRKGDDIAERLLALGAAVVKLLEPLSQRPGAKDLIRQLERCGPAGGANYEEARGAESPADFIHKVRIALKEVRETRYWLRLVLQAELLEAHQSVALIEEAGELIAILTASANTARRRAEQRT
jgi:four helix bundle protein